MMRYSYEECRDLWNIAERKSTISGQVEYVNHILRKFSLSASKHKGYMMKYYTRYINEKRKEISNE